MWGPIRLLGAFLAICLATLGRASTTVRVDGASVYVNETLVLTLKAGRNEERAATVAASFKKISSNPEFRVEGNAKSCRIIESGRVVVTVARLEAKAHGLTVPQLANLWLANLRKALTVPPIALPFDTLKLPLGKAQSVDLSGSQLAKIAIQTDDAKVVKATLSGAKLNLQPLALGESTISLSAGTFVKTLRVRVLPYAAVLPQSFSLSVTGDPASAETVRGALETALWTKFQSQSSTEATFKVPPVEAIGVEQARTYVVGVKAGGADTFPVEGQIQVTVRNEPLAYKAESELWYCNNPETVTRYQNLFAARLRSNDPIRFLYHHLNAMPGGLVIDAQAVNDSELPARILVIPGDKRDRNPVLAGLLAGDQLLRNWIRFSGEVVTVPPKSSVSLALRRLSPGETMSGLAYVRLLPGGPPALLVRVDSVPGDEMGAKAEAAMTIAAPWRRLPPAPITRSDRTKVELSAHVYPAPFKSEEVDFAVGGRHGFVRIGQKPIPRPDGKGLDGNFGVFYTIDAKMDNPQVDPADVEVVFEASAGYSGALFVLNGEVRRTPLLQPKEEAQIARIRLQPGEKKELTFLTVPLSGSSYPATIVVRPVGTGLGKLRMLLDDDSRPFVFLFGGASR